MSTPQVSGSPLIRRFQKRRALVPLVPAAVLFGTYLPLALQRSGWSDDYPMLLTSASAKHLSDMRPLGALLNTGVFSFVSEVADLWLLRLIGVVGVAVFAGFMAHLLHSWGVRPIYSALTAISVGLLPPFHAAAGWATVYKIAWVPMLGGISGIWFLLSWSENRRRRAALGFLGMVAACLFYPPAALFSWALLGIRSAIKPISVRRMLKESGLLAAMLGISLITALMIATVVNQILDVQADSRVALVSTLSAAVTKIGWFVKHPIGVAARPFLISSPSDTMALITAGPVLVLTGVGLYLRQKGDVWNRAAATGLLLVFMCLSMGSHLVSIENQIEYRYMIGITIALWVYLLVALHQLTTTAITALRARPRPTQSAPVLSLLVPILMGVVIVGAAWSAGANINQVFIKPFQSKEVYLNQALESFDTERHSRIVVIDDQSLWPHRLNLGIYSTVSDLAHPWVVEPNIRLLLEERGVEAESVRLDIVFSVDTVGPNDLVVDVRPYATMLRAGVPEKELRP